MEPQVGEPTESLGILSLKKVFLSLIALHVKVF
jgi:hypothetical protein